VGFEHVSSCVWVVSAACAREVLGWGWRNELGIRHYCLELGHAVLSENDG